MTRREFVMLSGGTTAWSLVARRALYGNADLTSPADLDRFTHRKGCP